MATKKPTSLSGPSVLPPPPATDSAKKALNRYGAVYGEDGRIVRSTGRNIQFATIVTAEFKDWIKSESKRRGKRMCVLLEDMRAAYEQVHGTRKK